MSRRIFSVSRIAKNVNFLSSVDRTSGICTDKSYDLAYIYVEYICSIFCLPLCTPFAIFVMLAIFRMTNEGALEWDIFRKVCCALSVFIFYSHTVHCNQPTTAGRLMFSMSVVDKWTASSSWHYVFTACQAISHRSLVCGNVWSGFIFCMPLVFPRA